jgi:uracil-DNA glycosylase
MAGESVQIDLPAVLRRLRETYPDARYELDWENPLQLLVATILAAQCTDERVNAVTPALFAKYRDAGAFARAELAELEEAVRPTGFYRNKARAIREACAALVERFDGEVPADIDDLITLPGVARKTANVVLNNAFRIPSGVIVDTHVARVGRRLGLTDEIKPERIEAELMAILPRDEWIAFGAAVVLHGRYTCTAQDPRCSSCALEDLCPKRGVAPGVATTTRSRQAVAAFLSEEAESEPELAPERPPRSSPATLDGEFEREPARPSDPPRRLGPARPHVEPTSSRDEAVPRPGSAVPAGADDLPADWRAILADELNEPYFGRLQEFLAEERRAHTVFPPEPDVFNALKLTPYERTNVLLLGQDPYHDDGQAHGLCFSVRPGIKPPPSLVNMFKELRDDLGCSIPKHGYLAPWAEQGVLMLNAVLTVRAHEPNSHKNQGWETFTDAVIRSVNARESPVVFVLWGAYAQKKAKLIDASRHPVLTAAHPSPLSAKKFFGSRPFSAINAALRAAGKPPIDWQLPERV